MTESRLESELKFIAADERPLRDLASADRLGPVELGVATTVSELDRYVDTTDLRLAGARWAGRLRTRDGRTIISLKGPAEHAAGDLVHRRPELEGPANPVLDPLGWPPSEARERLLAMTAGAPLVERFRLEQERTERFVTRGGVPLGTLSLDRVRAVSGETELGGMLVVELEFVMGAAGELDADLLASALARVAGLSPDPMSKFERVVAMLPAG